MAQEKPELDSAYGKVSLGRTIGKSFAGLGVLGCTRLAPAAEHPVSRIESETSRGRMRIRAIVAYILT